MPTTERPSPRFHAARDNLRRHRDDTLELLAAAEQAGNTRLAANHRQVTSNLDRIIDVLATLDEEPDDAAC